MRDKVDARSDDETGPDGLFDRVREAFACLNAACKLHDNWKRRLLPNAARFRTDRNGAGHLRRKLGDNRTQRTRKHVDAAHDEKVIGASDATASYCPATAAAGACLHDDMIATAKAQ